MKKRKRCEALLCLVGEAHTPNRIGLHAWLAIKKPRPLWFFSNPLQKKKLFQVTSCLLQRTTCRLIYWFSITC